MIHTEFVKCKYCNTKFALRFQIGEVEIPYGFNCPECNNYIYGIFNTLENVLCLENAYEYIPDELLGDYYKDVDYAIDLAIEFPCKKLRKVNSQYDVMKGGFSPFIEACERNDFDKLDHSFRSVQDALRYRYERWPIIKPLYDIMFSKHYDIIKKELHVFNVNYDIKNILDATMGLHQMFVCSVAPLLPDGSLKIFSNYSDTILLEFEPSELINLLEDLGGEDWFNSIVGRVVNQTNSFLNNIELMCPVIILNKTGSFGKVDFRNNGLAISDIESLLECYHKSYELCDDLLAIPAALNNIKHRGDYNIFCEDDRCKNIKEFANKSVYYKQEHIGKDEYFSSELDLRNRIRNSIAHDTYEYDSITQKITFIDKGERHPTYLIKLANLYYKNFKTMAYLNELLYALRKVYYMNQGCSINISWDRKSL